MTLAHLDTALGFAVIMLLLSLLITVLVQSIVAVLGLRGSNLRWGVARLLEQIDPKLAQHAEEIAERALRHSAVAPIGKRGATAIRADELIRVLDELVKSDKGWSDPQAKAALQRVLDELIPGGPAVTEKGEAIVAQVAGLFPKEAEAVRAKVTSALGATRKVAAGVSTWFDTVMDRTTERFVLHARWVTAAVAFLFALALHVDSLQLLQRLSTDSELRGRLVVASESALQRAEDVVVTAERRPLGSLAADSARAEARRMKTPTATAAADSVGDIPPNLITREQGEAWLRGRLKNADGADSLLAAYNRRFDEATKSWLGELRNSTTAIGTQLRDLTLQVVPNPYPSLKQYYRQPLHFIGTLMTGLLLTLGAPFWFNILRQLANLRPAIAGKVEAGKGDKEKAAK